MEEENVKRELPEERVEQTEHFQELIRGKYREDYLAALEDALSAQAREVNRYLAYRELMAQAETTKAKYPEFDLEKELEHPAFGRLLCSGVDPCTAYEVIHRREQECRNQRMAENACRPLENGLGNASLATVSKPDPRNLSRQERKLLRRRAARGEEIVW
ncbi:MAG: hypothetical protein IIY94_00885 [Oscillospiraceae bacterium]|nr:hypothetical protein [Oscillospiraceae bacterium]